MPETTHARHEAEGSNRLAELANEAIKTFREENPESYRELVQAYQGKSADVVLFGHGKFNIGVEKGEVEIKPNQMRGGGALGRGATTPETLMAMLEGRLTPLEAYFKSDLVARAESAELHKVYNYFVRFSDAAMRSQRLQALLSKFRESFGEKESPGKYNKV